MVFAFLRKIFENSGFSGVYASTMASKFQELSDKKGSWDVFDYWLRMCLADECREHKTCHRKITRKNVFGDFEANKERYDKSCHYSLIRKYLTMTYDERMSSSILDDVIGLEYRGSERDSLDCKCGMPKSLHMLCKDYALIEKDLDCTEKSILYYVRPFYRDTYRIFLEKPILISEWDNYVRKYVSDIEEDIPEAELSLLKDILFALTMGINITISRHSKDSLFRDLMDHEFMIQSKGIVSKTTYIYHTKYIAEIYYQDLRTVGKALGTLKPI